MSPNRAEQAEADDVPDPVPADVEAFIVREARLADEHEYEKWETLWDDEAFYWVPRDPEKDRDDQVSYIADSRRRISSRVAQLATGHRYAQMPPSRMRRLLTNFEVMQNVGDEIEVACNFVMYEHRLDTTVWAGRYRYRVVRRPDGLRLRAKVVELVNADGPLPTFAFLI